MRAVDGKKIKRGVRLAISPKTAKKAKRKRVRS